MGEGSYKTFGERNWYDNAAVPTAAILSDPNPSFTKKARRSNSLPGFAPGSAPRSADVFFFSSAILYLELYLGLCLELLPPTYFGPPAVTGDFGLKGPSICGSSTSQGLRVTPA